MSVDFRSGLDESGGPNPTDKGEDGNQPVHVSGLWIGNRLPPVAELCIRSFLHHGCRFSLYAYQVIENIPEGADVLDASLVLPEENLFLYSTGSFAPASDWFRFRMLADHGGIWVDMDIVCLRPFGIDGFPWFAWESPGIVGTGVIAFVAGDPIPLALAQLSADPAAPMPWDSPQALLTKEALLWRAPDVLKRRIMAPWGTAGPGEFTKALEHFGLIGKAEPSSSVFPIHYTGWRHAYDGTHRLDSSCLEHSWAVHLWGEMLRLQPDAMRLLAPGSLVSQLMTRHGVGLEDPMDSVENLSGNNSRILVGICSARGNIARRQAVRDSWFNQSPDGVDVCFFVGGGTPLEEERDVLCVDAPDDYDHLPQKVRAFFTACLEQEFDWLFKCDDDTYLALDRLRGIIVDGYDLVGNEFLESRGSPSGGAGYLLSRRMVEVLAYDRSLPGVGAEDVIIGEAAIRHGARFRATTRLCWNSSRFPRSDNDVVTSHWCTPERLRTIKELSDGEARLIEVRHRHWSDRLELSPGGAFARCSTFCCGRWFQGENGTIRLEWLDWPEEILMPVNLPDSRAEHRDGGPSVIDRYHCGIPMVECVVVELWGGLGNQMFQYAHGLALADRLGAALKLSFANYGRKFALHHFGLALDDDCPSDCFLIEDMDNSADGNEWPTWNALQESAAPNVKLRGYFQNEGFFRPVGEIVRRRFQIEATVPPESSDHTTVCVHVRRGDFLRSSLHNLCRSQYYRDAIRMMRGLIDKPYFLVLSDDPDWCKSEFSSEKDVRVVDCLGEKDTLAIMSGCQAFILSNSTFGWWGAWLARARPVIAPNRFLAGRAWNICKDDWIQIPPEGVGLDQFE